MGAACTLKLITLVAVFALAQALPVGAGEQTRSALPSKYSFLTYDYPGSIWTTLSGINNEGEVVGDYSLSNSIASGKNVRSFVRSLKARGTPISFTAPSGRQSTSPLSINDAGEIAGWYYDSRNKGHGYIRSDDGKRFITVDHPKAVVETSVIGINNTGLISGFYIDGRKTVHGYIREVAGGPFTTFDHPQGVGKTFATRISDTGHVVGFYRSNSATSAFIRSPSGTFTTFRHPRGGRSTKGVHITTVTCGQAINDLGEIAGFYVDRSGLHRGYVRSTDGKTFNTISHPLGKGGTMVFGINDVGQVAGLYVDARGKTHGFVATPIARA